MRKINFGKYFFPLILFLLVALLFWTNYEKETMLLGWDSLHPEFDFPLAFKRAFFGVWREDQGVGAIAAHSHMSELPRLAILWLFSFFLPLSLTRYFFVFLTLLLGVLGIYVFLKETVKSTPASFLGASFYLLNLITLQHFFVPFEMFLIAYGLLPWLFLSSVKYLKSGKGLVFLALTALLFSSAAYAATLFYACFASLALFLFSFSLFGQERIKAFKRSFLILILVLLVNSFWLLPNIYSVVKQGETVAKAKTNLLFSPEAFLRNKEYGTFKDIAQGKNFLFSWRAYDHQKGEFKDLMGVWNEWAEKGEVKAIGFLFFGISFLGFVLVLLKKEKYGLAVIFPWLFCLFFLINANPPTASIYDLLYQKVPLFREGFRFPFTKFSIPFLFFTTFFFAFALNVISKKKVVKPLVTVSLFSLLIYYMLPAFKGNFISPLLKTQIPTSYFDLFDWFEGKEGRVARFPIDVLWGWRYHSWGYEGLGFEWFGMKNPLFDRDSDRFSPANESFYQQASFALYTKNLAALERVIQKFNVRYILIDESVINPGADEKNLFIEETKELFNQSSHIRPVAQFGFLSVYETDFAKEMIFAPKDYARVKALTDYSVISPVDARLGTYIESQEGIWYPFASFDKRNAPEVKFKEQEIILKSFEEGDFENLSLPDPDLYQIEAEANLSATLKDKRVEVEIPTESKLQINLNEDFGFEKAFNCDLLSEGRVFRERKEGGVIYRAEAGGVSCDFLAFSDLAYRKGYILRLKGENKEGRSLKIYLTNLANQRVELEELLPEGEFDEAFFILPKDLEGEGYVLNLETRSFGRLSSENGISAVEVYEIPIAWLTDIFLTNLQGSTLKDSNVKLQSISKHSSSLYSLEAEGDGLFVLDQGFEEGWRAYLMANGQCQMVKGLLCKIFPWWFGEKLTHVKVNSWANGWIINRQPSTIMIIFWPQYLEYVGLIIVFLVFGTLLVRRHFAR